MEVVRYLINFDLQFSVKFNGRKLNQLLVFIILALGVKALLNILKRAVLNVVWQGLRDGWTGALSLRSSTIERSDIFNDNWPSMKNIFR